ncbi:MAG: SDR family oxidoreductase [Phycisphaerales bacterium JB038]
MAFEKPILVTGASGYIGGRLVPRLLAAGYRVRCLARDPRKLQSRAWASEPGVEIVAGDLAEAELLRERLAGCAAAYYLVHSMIAKGSAYLEQDRLLARHFAEAAQAAGVDRIVYLGGLGEMGDSLSKHLASRREVETVLASTGVPVTVLRAAMVIGSGSASFEILRYLVERLPIMVTPRWVSTECEPVAIENVLHYLVACLETPETSGRTLDIGGGEVLNYRQIMQVVAEVLHLRKRLVIPVPVLTPRLSSLWIHLVTPLGKDIARPLAEGLRNRVVCRNDEAVRLMPQRLLGVREAVQRAIAAIERNEVRTSWHDAGPIPGDPDWAGGRVFVDQRSCKVRAAPQATFATVARLGGETGYYAANWLWQLRGWMDRLVGGPGLRRGRRDPEHLVFGDALDFWRVTRVDPDARLDLRAEMKLPGEALLRFQVQPAGGGASDRCTLVQTARFKPRGLLGLAYWYAVWPLHGPVFRSMLQGIRRAAERRAPSPGPDSPTMQA